MPRVSTDTTAEAPSLALQLAPADMVDTARFDAPRKQQVAVIAASVSVADSNTVATFGAGPQRKLSGFLDQLLTGVRADEIGTAGALVTELATGLKMLDLPGVRREVEGRAGLLARLPIVGRYVSALRRFRAMQKQVVDHMAAIERKAEVHLGKLKASNAGLDRLLDATEANLRELEVWVAAGQQALMRLRDGFEVERLALATSRDAVGLAKLRDMAEQVNAFETRLVRMHVAFTRGVLSIPQVRIAQQAGRIEIQNTLDTILFDLPDLKGGHRPRRRPATRSAAPGMRPPPAASIGQRAATGWHRRAGPAPMSCAKTDPGRHGGPMSSTLSRITRQAARHAWTRACRDRPRKPHQARGQAVQQLGEVREPPDGWPAQRMPTRPGNRRGPSSDEVPPSRRSSTRYLPAERRPARTPCSALCRRGRGHTAVKAPNAWSA